MQGAFEKILAAMRGSRDGMLPSIQSFAPLDLEALSRDLSLEGRASENGGGCRPGPSDAGPDTPELDIHAAIEGAARKGAEEYRSQLALYDRRIRESVVSADVQVQIEAAGENALSDFKVQSTYDSNHLLLTREECEGRQAEFDAFRAKHRLAYLPKIVSPRERTFRWLVIGICFVLESILNGLFFAQGSDHGLIGGVVEATGLSAINILVAMATARLAVPAIVHRRRSLNAGGVLLILVYVALAIAINLFIAHYRDLYRVAGEDVQLVAVVASFLQGPGALTEVRSWLLAGLGVFFSVTAFFSVMGLDEPYFRYGAIGRAREDAINRYTDEKASCLTRLARRRTLAVDAMTDVIQEVRRQEFERRLAVTGRERLHRDYLGYLAHLEASHERLVRLYRETNVKARPEGCGAPEYFSRPIARPVCLEPPGPLAELPHIDDEPQARVVERLSHYIRAVNAEYATRSEQYGTQPGTSVSKPRGVAPAALDGPEHAPA